VVELSGLDEQNNVHISRSNLDYQQFDKYKKWIFGYFECTICKHRTYHDVPWYRIRRAEAENINIETVKNTTREMFKKIYGIVGETTDLTHKDGMCGGPVIYRNTDEVNIE
jgi:hypothetical protein